MAPYVSVPMNVKEDMSGGDIVKVLMPLEFLEIIEGEKGGWVWSIEKEDAVPARCDEPCVTSFKSRAGIGGVCTRMIDGVCDMRNLVV